MKLHRKQVLDQHMQFGYLHHPASSNNLHGASILAAIMIIAALVPSFALCWVFAQPSAREAIGGIPSNMEQKEEDSNDDRAPKPAWPDLDGAPSGGVKLSTPAGVISLI